MKRYAILVLVLALLLALTACGTEGETPLPDPTVYETPTPLPDVVTVVDIVDRAERDGLGTAEALEGFYGDGEWLYYFPSIRSAYVTVYYSDGTEEPVREALAAGRVTIADLDRFGIGYYKQKLVTVVGMDCQEGVLTALGHFWSDGEYDYYFPCCDTEVTVHLSDGRSLPLQDALWEGRATIADLDRFGISYYRELILRIVDIVDRAVVENIPTDDAVEIFWTDGEFDYAFSSIRSHLVLVRYNDGTEEPIKLALESGRATIGDLDRFDIDYLKGPTNPKTAE